jgi:glycosyltransferase involved in cell wall biosynthesis
MSASPVELSVVVPVYGCADCLRPLCERIATAVGPITRDYEIVLVDDRSPDGAWQAIRDLSAADARVRGTRLSRNFGQHAAITAGFAESRGRRVVVMDCDLQDPPEEISRLYERSVAGKDIVLARRVGRRHSWLRRKAARAYFRLMRTFVNAELDGDYGTFSIVTRPVVDAYLDIGDRGRHYLFILNWLGFDRDEIAVTHDERAAGQSSYTFRRLMGHALEGLFFQTTVVLRWIIYFGFGVSVGGIGLAAYLAYFALANHPYPGWTSLAVLILLIGGFIMISTGVTGLYIGQIFEQVKARPIFVVDERTGGDHAS